MDSLVVMDYRLLYNLKDLCVLTLQDERLVLFHNISIVVDSILSWENENI